MGPLEAGALRLAAARGDVAAMSQLASGCARFSADASIRGFTPLHAAAIEGKAAAAVWLLERGASVAAVKDDEW